MRVLFSNPPWWGGRQGSWIDALRGKARYVYGVRAGSRWPHTRETDSRPDRNSHAKEYLPYPFFMGYAATYVAKETGADVELRDSIALGETYADFYRYIRSTPFDYIVIESATPSWGHDLAVMRQIKSLNPAKIVVTGPMATKSADVLNTGVVHAVIKGEYEKGMVDVVNGVEGVVDFNLLTLEEMNAAPFPHFDDKIWNKYWDSNPRGQIAPHAQVWSSRGCPYKCIFCVWPATMTGNDPNGEGKRTVRQYSADYMEAFLTELTERYDFKCIYFDDDTFNLGNRHVEAMCQVMAKIGLPWSAMCRADTIKLDAWKLMKESGCFGVKLGFESGNQYVVDQIVNKHLDLEYAAEIVRELKQLGMTVHGTFTYGLPGETKEQMLETRAYREALPFDSYQESGTAEIEGTPMANLTEGEILRRYKGAVRDGGYDRRTDGNVKFHELSKKLQLS